MAEKQFVLVVLFIASLVLKSRASHDEGNNCMLFSSYFYFISDFRTEARG